MNKLICILIIGSILISCSVSRERHNDLIGNYQSYLPNIFKQVIVIFKRNVFHYNGHIQPVYFSKGLKFNILSDSTYTLHYCNKTIAGIWRIKNDSLILTHKTQVYKSDSLTVLPLDGRIGLYMNANGELEECEYIVPKNSLKKPYVQMSYFMINKD